MNPSVRVVCRGCLRSVEKMSAMQGADSGRCPYCGDLLDSRSSSSQTDEGPDLEADDARGTSQSPTEIRDTIDWIKTWAQGSLGLLGRFQLRERLGDGGFGSVFRAYDPRLDRDVAVKVLKQRNPSDRTMERFFREARAVARLDHPNIVSVYDSGFDDGRCWVAYQLVSGRPLWWYREHHPMDAATSARIVRALADALDHSHHLGVVHRDLKPSNVIIDDRGQPRLIDFGLARRSDLESDLTREGAILGTPAYMSPEQALGHSRQVDDRTDVYSLGVIFYELLTGRHPDEPTTASSDQPAATKPHAGVVRRASPGHSICPSVPRELRQICNKAMATDPGARYPTARALADALDSWLMRQEHQSVRLRFVLAGVALGVSLALILFIAIKFVAAVGTNRQEPGDDRASITRLSSLPAAEPKDSPAKTPVTRARWRQPPSNKTSRSSAEAQLVGNSRTQRYHLAGCPHVASLAENNRVILANAGEAAQKGYTPCKDCNPPLVKIAPTQFDSSAEPSKKK